MGKLRYKGYTGNVDYDESVHRLVGKVLGLKKVLIMYEGETLEELEQDFREGVDHYLESCRLDGIVPEAPYSGKLILRISSSLHGQAAEKASELGISLNEFISRALRAALL